MQDMRSTNNLKEIALTLKQIAEKSDNVLIWQTNKDTESRNIIPAKINSINFEEKSILLKPKEDYQFDFDNDLTLYFHSEHRSLIFKLGKSTITKNMLIIRIPNEAKLVELRRDNREVYSGRRPRITYDRLKAYGSETMEYKSELLDLSDDGMAFVLSSINRTQFHEGDIIRLKGIGSKDLVDIREGEIMYIVPLDANTKTSAMVFRVGVKFKA